MIESQTSAARWSPAPVRQQKELKAFTDSTDFTGLTLSWR
jgi:hypothetical protein